MVGLLARDTLALSLFQQGILIVNAAIWLRHIYSQDSGLLTASVRGRPRGMVVSTACVTLALSLWAFWGTQVCFDTQLTWQILSEYRGRLISLREIGLLGHLNSNPPVWGWYVSALPEYPMQQLYATALSGLILGLCAALYGHRTTALIAAAPLFQICCTQPLGGLYAVACLLAARRCRQLGHTAFMSCGWNVSASCFLLAAAYWKYTVYVLLPWMAWVFGRWSLPVFGGLALYWTAFARIDSETCARQARYLLHVYSFGLARRLPASPGLSPGRTASRSVPILQVVLNSAAWRLPPVSAQSGSAPLVRLAADREHAAAYNAAGGRYNIGWRER